MEHDDVFVNVNTQSVFLSSCVVNKDALMLQHTGKQSSGDFPEFKASLSAESITEPVRDRGE